VVLASVNDDYIKSLIDQTTEPVWFSEIRENAFSKYTNLPSEISPLYKKYSDVNRLKPEYIYLPDRIIKSEPYEDLKDRLDELEQGTSVLRIGSSINRIVIPDKVSKQGVIISDLGEAITKYEDLIKKQLTINQLNYNEDRFLALEASAFQSGLFVYIPKNVIIEDPIRIVNSLADDGNSSITRNLIVSDVGSKATVVQEIYSPSKANRDHVQQAYFELVECHINPTAHLEMVTLQAMSAKTVNFSNKRAFIE